MSAFPSYATGTVSVASGATVIAGSGTIWSGVNVRPGDDIVIAGHTVIVEDVTDPTHLVIDAWPYGNVSAGTAYKIVQRSPLRYAGGQAMADVSALVAALNTDGFYVFVASSLSAPDPSYGNENQFAFQASTGKLWLKTGGAWAFQGIYKGFNIRGAYDNAAAYALGDVVASAGSSYVWSSPTSASGHAPPDPTYWQLLAAKGDIGSTGPQGAGYGGSSTTSLAIGTGAKAFTTQSGLAYQAGARVRATSTADVTKWMEGVATYSGTTLTITVDKVSGTGTLASWSFNVAGQPGSGDLSSTNNLSDVADKNAALSTLGGVSSAASQTLDDAHRLLAIANLGVPFQCGRLTYVSTTALKFSPVNGDLHKVAGSVYRIPAAGIVGLANTAVYVNGTPGQNLAPLTLYYVYSFSAAGVLTADFSTTGHGPSTTAGNVGTEIKNGDDTRSLIGMVYTNASSQFSDALTASWFNRRMRSFASPQTSPGSAGAYFVEIAGGTSIASPGSRAYFLIWGDENSAIISVSAAVGVSSIQNNGVACGVDSATVGSQLVPQFQNNNQNIGSTTAVATGLTEGLHYSCFMGGHNAGSGPTYGNCQSTATVRN
jgi:hypothetical protein